MLMSDTSCPLLHPKAAPGKESIIEPLYGGPQGASIVRGKSGAGNIHKKRNFIKKPKEFFSIPPQRIASG